MKSCTQQRGQMRNCGPGFSAGSAQSKKTLPSMERVLRYLKRVLATCPFTPNLLVGWEDAGYACVLRRKWHSLPRVQSAERMARPYPLDFPRWAQNELQPSAFHLSAASDSR